MATGVRVAALVPAYNEEKTVGQVVDALRTVALIDEVIVISDGSADDTARVAAEHSARVIDLAANVGKAGAIKAGLEATTAGTLLMVDADLIGLTAAHLESLLLPVLSGQTDMTVGLFEGGRVATELAQIVAPYLSGQRALGRHLLEAIEDLGDLRFGIEVALTKQASAVGARTLEVLLPGVTQVMKEEKRGFVRGFAARMQMYRDIVKYVVKG